MVTGVLRLLMFVWVYWFGLRRAGVVLQCLVGGGLWLAVGLGSCDFELFCVVYFV